MINVELLFITIAILLKCEYFSKQGSP